jgi:hypothetical protein
MQKYKRNQVQEAIFQTSGAQGARADEIRFRLKRLLATDRGLGCRRQSQDKADRHYAFYGAEPPGTGADVMYSAYEAFALLASITLLEHGLPQVVVVKMMRQIRDELEVAHADTLEKHPSDLFDQDAIRAHAKPGMFAFDSIDPVILVFLRLTGSSVDEHNVGTVVSVCRNSNELSQFIKKHGSPGTGFSIFEFSRLIHLLAENLSHARAVKRGRATILP